METQLTRSSHVVWEELGEEVLLVIPATGARWLLNAAAAAIWKLTDGTRTLADMAANLALPNAELATFCRAFERQGLLQPAGTNHAAPLFASESHFAGTPHFPRDEPGQRRQKTPEPERDQRTGVRDAISHLSLPARALSKPVAAL